MNSIRAIQKLNQRELEEGVTPEGSWHTDYRDTAIIYIGGLPFELSEGDVITIFSQYGEPVWIKLARDKETGKSRGFCWIKYEDQRSTDLAVDNLGGATIMGRTLRVDHARYKPRDDEDMRDNTMGEPVEEDFEDDKRRKRRRTHSDTETESEEERPLLPEEIELGKLIRELEDDDPMKASMVKRKQEEVDVAVKKFEKAKRKELREKRHHARRHRHDGSREHDRHRERRRIKDREESEDEHKHSNSRRRDTSRDYKGQRDRARDEHEDDEPRQPRHRRRNDSSDEAGRRHDDRREHDRRRRGSDGEDYKRPHHRRSPRREDVPRKDESERPRSRE